MRFRLLGVIKLVQQSQKTEITIDPGLDFSRDSSKLRKEYFMFNRGSIVDNQSKLIIRVNRTSTTIMLL